MGHARFKTPLPGRIAHFPKDSVRDRSPGMCSGPVRLTVVRAIMRSTSPDAGNSTKNGVERPGPRFDGFWGRRRTEAEEDCGAFAAFGSVHEVPLKFGISPRSSPRATGAKR